MQPKIIPVILSGGAGTRLWPVSTPQRPKPFMAMPDGETLLAKTLNRANRLAPDGPIVTVTGQGYRQITQEEYERVGCVAPERLHYVLEPAARNTAPAVAMAMAVIGQTFGPDCVAVIMPSDHLIGDEVAFFEAVEKAANLALKGLLVTFGIVPQHPETGYGYIHADEAIGGGLKVRKFVEKPPLETAQRYVESGDYLWNSGMFCFTPAGFADAVRAVDPGFAENVQVCLEESSIVDQSSALDERSFGSLPATSIDYALMEKAPRVAVVPADMAWNDVGSWSAIADLAEADRDGNFAGEGHFLIDARRCFVSRSERPIAVIGMDNVVVIDHDDALLICDRDQTQKVKQVVERLRTDPEVDT